MRKLIVTILLVAAVGLGVVSANGLKGFPSSQMANMTPTLTPAPTTMPVGDPVTLRIPKININTTIESVGQDKKGRMDVPQNPMDVGWYDLGFKPGEDGSAVIDGHLDLVTGAPAVFWNLSKLQQGDQVIVTDGTQKTYTFTVVDKEVYPYNDAPLEKIFSPSSQPKLNLITCNGVWDRQTHNYSNRVVVYTQMQ